MNEIEFMCWRKHRVSDSRVMWASSANAAAIKFAHMQRIEGCIIVCDEGGNCALFEVADGAAELIPNVEPEPLFSAKLAKVVQPMTQFQMEAALAGLEARIQELESKSAQQLLVNDARESEKVTVRAALQVTMDRAFAEGVTAGIKTALREVEAHQGESVLTIRMKIRALLEPRT